jgi:hypothetical protein
VLMAAIILVARPTVNRAETCTQDATQFNGSKSQSDGM